MRLLMESRECTDASCAVVSVDSSCHVKKSRPYVRITGAGSQSCQWRYHFLSCIIILAFVFIQNAGLATAGIVLPVIRSFSKFEGSGTEEGSYGMSPQHAKELRNHDYQRSYRHKRLLTSVADFPLAGNEYWVGLYYTVIGLGTPSDQYYVQVDTGSDLLWVNCKPCQNCPADSDLQIPLRLYDPAASETSKNTSCSSNNCKTVANIADSPCIDNSCYYAFSYGDGSTAMGYLVEDMLTYETMTNNTISNAITKLVFGCGFNQSGDTLTSSSRAVDGIMGFGRQVLSVITQLADNGLTTRAFAHCLQGDTGEGGIFVIGDVQEPGMVYTKMVANKYHYNVVLLSISVGDVDLNISPSVFDANSYSRGEGGTIFDCGTTLALLVDAAYVAFVNELTAVVTVQAFATSDSPETPCFEYSNNDLSAAFPSVTLNFEGASMRLGPTNYLYKLSVGESTSIWCLGWSRSSSSNLDGLTILGDIVVKNKLVVYDLGNEQIGWVDYNCHSSVQVSNGTGNQVLQPLQSNINSGYSHFLPSYHPVAVLICSAVLAYAAAFL